MEGPPRERRHRRRPGLALSSLGLLLRDAGQVAEAERAYRRSVEIYEALWKANPEDVGIGDGLGWR